jgi:hypothetical protein
VWWCARHAAERAIWPRRVVALKVPVRLLHPESVPGSR